MKGQATSLMGEGLIITGEHHLPCKHFWDQLHHQLQSKGLLPAKLT